MTVVAVHCWIAAINDPADIALLSALVVTLMGASSAVLLHATRSQLRERPRRRTTVVSWVALGALLSAGVADAVVTEFRRLGFSERSVVLGGSVTGIGALVLLCISAYAAHLLLSSASYDPPRIG